ncbi:hypothetical protein OCV58_10415, partial [Megasphaera butyrica]|uniref:hypothetical protein n=1 Tax=Megasphaera butyrica TaxID=2981791 RepID=UPI0022659AB3
MKMTKPKAINRKKLVAFALLVSNNSLHTVAHPGIRYNKFRKNKKRHGLQNSGRMKSRHTILKG